MIAFVNEAKIYKLLAWKFLRYNYSGYTHGDPNEREKKSIEVNIKQQQHDEAEVYACSSILGAISTNRLRVFFLLFFFGIDANVSRLLGRRCILA